jgi:hypothetical protein
MLLQNDLKINLQGERRQISWGKILGNKAVRISDAACDTMLLPSACRRCQCYAMRQHDLALQGFGKVVLYP